MFHGTKKFEKIATAISRLLSVKTSIERYAFTISLTHCALTDMLALSELIDVLGGE